MDIFGIAFVVFCSFIIGVTVGDGLKDATNETGKNFTKRN